MCRQVGGRFPFMPDSATVSVAQESPDLFFKHKNLARVVFFGGSFNPWHDGHRACLDLCPEESVVVVPDNNPWKAEQVREENPWEFCLNLARQLEETPHSLYPGFLGRSEPNPTVDWLLKVDAPERGLLLGDDNFISFDRWKDYQALAAGLAVIYVAPRKGDREKLDRMKEHLLEINPRLEVVFLPHHAYEDCNSTSQRSEL